MTASKHKDRSAADTTAWCASLYRLGTNTDGKSTVEYAVMLAMVIVSVSAGIYCVGQLSNTGFDQASSVMASLDSDQVGNGKEIGSAGNGVHAVPASFMVVLGAAFFFVCCGTVIVFFLSRRREHGKSKIVAAAPTVDAEMPSVSDVAFGKRQQMRRVFQNNMSSLLNGDLKARHIMSRQVSSVRSKASIEEVRELMEAKQIAHVLVRDEENRLVGIISKADIQARQGKKAKDVMTADPYTLDVDAEISVGITQLISRKVICLPVVDKNRELTGVITSTDFLLAFQCAIQTLGGVVDHIRPQPAS